jgi:DNA-binding transcriptional regulator YiaG
MSKLATLPTSATELLRLAVRSARKATGLSLLHCSIDVKVSTDTIMSWEAGRTRPDVAKLLDAPKMGPAFRAELERALAERRAA